MSQKTFEQLNKLVPYLAYACVAMGTALFGLLVHLEENRGAGFIGGLTALLLFFTVDYKKSIKR